jgi:hypothetical protein
MEVATTTPLASGADVYQGSDLVVDAQYVYWINSPPMGATNGDVRKVPIGGGPPVTIASTPKTQGIALSGNALVWLTFDKVMKLVLDGSAPVSLGPVVQGPNGPPGGINVMVADAQHIFWLQGRLNPQMPYDGDVMMMPSDGSAAALSVATTTLSGVAPRTMAMDGANVYWIGEGNVLYKWQPGATLPIGIASGYDMGSMAVGATGIYYVKSDPATGCALMLATPK